MDPATHTMVAHVWSSVHAHFKILTVQQGAECIIFKVIGRTCYGFEPPISQTQSGYSNYSANESKNCIYLLGTLYYPHHINQIPL